MRESRRFGGAILFVALALCPMHAGAQDKKADAKVKVHKEVVFGTGGEMELKLDLAMPSDLKDRAPAIVCLHGGGWRMGKRQDLALLIELFAQRGFVAVTASYRLAPDHKFPAQIEDSKAAVRWLRANAAKFSVQADRIGVIGFSAGGHLACLLGTADKDAELEGKGGNAKESSRVQAVVSFFGPTDFTVKSWDKSAEDFFLVPFLGGTFEEKKEHYCKASPIHYVSKDDPPFLFFHGDKDGLVNINESKKLAAKLTDAGVPARLVTLKDAGHGWKGEELTRTLEQSVEFFVERLKK